MEINNLTSFTFDREKLIKIVEKILKEEKAKGDVAFALVDKKEIRKLNRIYREKDYVTDVLSFFYDEKDFLGEVLLCPEKIKEDRGESEREFLRVAIHGVLHILGYDHEKKEEEEREMKEKTEHYLQEI